MYLTSKASSESSKTIFDDSLPWHVILAISLVSAGLLITAICILWSCMRQHCCSFVPKKIGKLRLIVRQPSVVSLGDDISNQRTWVTTTSMSNMDENKAYQQQSQMYPSLFEVLPSLQRLDVKNLNQNRNRSSQQSEISANSQASQV